MQVINIFLNTFLTSSLFFFLFTLSMKNHHDFFEEWNGNILQTYKNLNLTCQVPMMMNFPEQSLGLPFCSNWSDAFNLIESVKETQIPEMGNSFFISLIY